MTESHELPPPVTATDMYLAAINDRLRQLLDRLPDRTEPERDDGTVELREPAAGPADTVREPAEDVPRRPENRAPKAEWVEYAVACGMDRVEAGGLSKTVLMAATRSPR